MQRKGDKSISDFLTAVQNLFKIKIYRKKYRFLAIRVNTNLANMQIFENNVLSLVMVHVYCWQITITYRMVDIILTKRDRYILTCLSKLSSNRKKKISYLYGYIQIFLAPPLLLQLALDTLHLFPILFLVSLLPLVLLFPYWHHVKLNFSQLCLS